MGTTNALTDLRHTIELALRGGITVSAGAGRLPAHRVPPMPPLRLVDGSATVTGAPTFTGVAHRQDLAA